MMRLSDTRMPRKKKTPEEGEIAMRKMKKGAYETVKKNGVGEKENFLFKIPRGSEFFFSSYQKQCLGRFMRVRIHFDCHHLCAHAS